MSGKDKNMKEIIEKSMKSQSYTKKNVYKIEDEDGYFEEKESESTEAGSGDGWDKTFSRNDKKWLVTILVFISVFVIFACIIVMQNRQKNLNVAEESKSEMNATEDEIQTEEPREWQLEVSLVTSDADKARVDEKVREYIERPTLEAEVSIQYDEYAYFWLGDFPMLLIKHTSNDDKEIESIYHFSVGRKVMLVDLPTDIIPWADYSDLKEFYILDTTLFIKSQHADQEYMYIIALVENQLRIEKYTGDGGIPEKAAEVEWITEF